MKKPAPRRQTRSRRTATDAQLAEFHRRDLDRDIPGSARVLRRTRPTSIALEPEIIAKLRVLGAKRGLGYQTMLKLIVREHLDEY